MPKIYTGKCHSNQNYVWGNTDICLTLEWFLSRKQMTRNSSKNVQQKLPLFTVVVSVHRYSHYRNKHGVITRIHVTHLYQWCV